MVWGRGGGGGGGEAGGRRYPRPLAYHSAGEGRQWRESVSPRHARRVSWCAESVSGGGREKKGWDAPRALALSLAREWG
jgi:hypothetical protein